MIFTVHLNKDDYRAFRRYCLTRFHHAHWLLVIMIAVVEIMTWHGHKPETPLSEKIGSALAIPVLFAVLFGVLMVLKWIVAKVTRSSFQQPLGPHEYEITDSMFREKNEFGSTEATLNRIKTVGQTKNHVFIILSNGLGYIIPRREIAAPDLDQILERLKGIPQPPFAGDVATRAAPEK
jgi:hypothetical protein